MDLLRRRHALPPSPPDSPRGFEAARRGEEGAGRGAGARGAEEDETAEEEEEEEENVGGGFGVGGAATRRGDRGVDAVLAELTGAARVRAMYPDLFR